MSEKDLRQMDEVMSSTDEYLDKIADKVYDRLFKDFSRVEDYMKSANERYHYEHAKKYRSLERRVFIAAICLLILQFLFK